MSRYVKSVCFGVGGVLTLRCFGDFRTSIEAGPWTLGAHGGVNQTVRGGFITLSAAGFVHGPGSNNSSTATPSGVIQPVSPRPRGAEPGGCSCRSSRPFFIEPR